MPTISELLDQVSALLGRRDLSLQELQAWMTGTADGGPDSDGRYPMSLSDGTPLLFRCPASMEDIVDEFAELVVAAVPFTYSPTHRQKRVRADFSGTVTLPADADVGNWFILVQGTAAPVSFAPAAGASLHSADESTSTGGAWSVVMLMVARNADGASAEWVLSGKTGPVWPERLEWDGVTRFTHGPGANWSEIGFDRYRPWVNPATAIALWDNFVTWTDATGKNRWQRAAEAEMDVIRVMIDPQKFLETDGSDAALAPWLTVIGHVVDSVLAHNMKIIICMTPATGGDQGSLGENTLRWAYANQDPLWDKAVKVWTAVDKLLNAYESGEAALELWNESEEYPSGTPANDVYIHLISALHKAMRKIVGPRIKHIIGSPFYASHVGFTGSYSQSGLPDAGFKANLFGKHVGYACHAAYYPNIFTHQGLYGNDYQFIHRMAFPADPAVKDATIAAYQADAAAAGVSSGKIAQVTNDLNLYFTQNNASSGYDGTKPFTTTSTMNYVWGNPDPNAAYVPAYRNYGEHIHLWMYMEGVSGEDMHCTEIGWHRDYDDIGDNIGADTDSAARHGSLVRKYAEARRMNGLVLWADETKHFSVNENIAAPGAEPDYSGQIQPQIAVAVGLRSNWTPSVLGARLDQYLDPLDASTVTYSTGRKVAQLADKSGNARHEMQADPDLQMTFDNGYLIQRDQQWMASSLSASDQTQWLFQVIYVEQFGAEDLRTVVGASGDGGRLLVLSSAGTREVFTLQQNSGYVSGPNVTMPIPAGRPVLLGVQYHAGVEQTFGVYHVYHLNMQASAALFPENVSFGSGLTSTTGFSGDGAYPHPFVGGFGGRIAGHGDLSDDDIQEIKRFLMARHGIAE
ncbi:hypothetical protein [Sphingobium aquiterrae]|uniref:hypothetical protein n=1 Tax=Sphingobium aquiterrae TaxID=2038656 RepID=UPI003016F595